MQDTYAFIGCGNMGGALARALCKQVPPQKVLLCDPQQAEALSKELGCRVGSQREAAQCGTIFLGIKPHLMAEALQPMQALLAARKDRFILVSMAAGLPIARLHEMLGGAYPVIRIMPNTACAVGEGMTLYCAAGVKDEELAAFAASMAGAGRLDPLDESLIDAGSGITGCGGAFACLFLEALADGGVACGLPRGKAREYAAQMLLGTAKLALTSGEHTGALKDAVCSPGGSTIAGVRALEQGGFRGTAMEAVIAAYEKTKLLGKN
ncbi:MAG: pyrroline-5-carboxylate reductase [Christensenellaceae bacterium]|nr:pyrroline-5-carboxylate reductase [Christensenellaceae bacterium]